MRTRAIMTVGAAVFIVAPSAGCQSGDTGSPPATATSSASASSGVATTSPPPAPAPPPPAGPLVQLDQLKAVLPDPGQVSAAVNVPNLGISESHDALDLLPDDYASDMACVGAISDAAIQPYAETPVVLVRTQNYAPANGSGSLLATASAVLYETVQDAQDQVTATVNAWHGCAGKPIQVKTVPPSTFTIGAASLTGAVNTVVNSRPAPPGPAWACARGVTARNNVVIDLTVCAGDPAAVGAGAAALANQIAAKVPA